MWSVDAYHDRDATEFIDGNKTAWGYETGKLAIPVIMDLIKDDLITMHPQTNRAATIMCLRLKFNIEG